MLATRATKEAFDAVHAVEPRAEYHETARAITLNQTAPVAGKGTISVVCAGTSDLPVAEEAVTMYQVLATNSPNNYSSDLDWSRTLLSTIWKTFGRKPDSDTAGEEWAGTQI